MVDSLFCVLVFLSTTLSITLWSCKQEGLVQGLPVLNFISSKLNYLYWGGTVTL